MFLYCTERICQGKKNKVDKPANAVKETPLYLPRIEKYKRKEILSPRIKWLYAGSIRTFFFAPLRAALTVEAAVVLPLFLFFMIGTLQYASVMETAVKFGTALSETGKDMATAAYAGKYVGDENAGTGASLAAGALSAVYAQSAVVSKVGDLSAVKSVNMILSSFLQEDAMIDLVLTYQIKSPFGVVNLPGNFFLQRARIRAWTGRTLPEDRESEDSAESQMVYVTETGTVYHVSAECSHLKLSVHATTAEAVKVLRNTSGAIYYACEKCGEGAGNTVYITDDGTRYHSSLTCSGLKRTVKQVSLDEVSGMRVCSRCGKGI